MKLKKIASLMLAGIMAVSMLAACGEGKGNSSSSSSSSQPTVTTNDITSDVYNSLEASTTSVLDTKTNAYLGNALKTACESLSVAQVADIVDSGVNYYLMGTQQTADDVRSFISNALGGNYKVLARTDVAGEDFTADGKRVFLYKFNNNMML